MKKIFLAAPLMLALYACGDKAAETEPKTETPAVEQVQEETKERVSLAANADWTADERLQEPTEDTVCANCNMKVYTKDHELGAFAGQAIQADGSVLFYDDIGCLLTDASADKYVRDYATLNWFKVEEAIVVKTSLKTPMNWGYAFFKYQEDADAFLAENPDAAITPFEQVQTEAAERHAQKHGDDHQHGAMDDDGQMDEHNQEEGEHSHMEEEGHSSGESHE